MIHFYGFVSMLFTLFMGGCNDVIIDPSPQQPPQEKKWEEIALFKNADITSATQSWERVNDWLANLTISSLAAHCRSDDVFAGGSTSSPRARCW